jgi:ribosomal protein S18 acetylase RimI-like enzyme
MQDLAYKKGYQEETALRKSFNELASQTFGINFESWYQKGQWTDKYIPYSYIVGGDKVVANVSVNKVDFIINGEERRAIQIGTVMTDPSYRNQGLSRRLMEIVLEEYQSTYDFIYLFANQTVLEFYPKFGFERMEESHFYFDVCGTHQEVPFRKLNPFIPKDFSLIEELVTERVPLSKDFATINTKELFMFYCLNVFDNDLYYWEEEEVLVIYQKENEELHLFDVVSKVKINTNELLQKLASTETKKVIFHFTPEGMSVSKKKIISENDVLFVRKNRDFLLPKDFKHPITAKA